MAETKNPTVFRVLGKIRAGGAGGSRSTPIPTRRTLSLTREVGV